MAKILVIDDSAFFRQFERGLLEEAGYQVEDFHPASGLEVLERARAFEPDLVLTDFNMPNVDGTEVVRMIRRHSASLPVVMLTAAHDPEREARLKNQGALWILHKPIKGDQILEAVKKIVQP